jgi:hypothetical protein
MIVVVLRWPRRWTMRGQRVAFVFITLTAAHTSETA